MFNDCVIVEMEKLPSSKANGKVKSQIDRCCFTLQVFGFNSNPWPLAIIYKQHTILNIFC